MIAELGHYALVLALALALVQSSVPIIGARKSDPALMAVAGPTALAQFCFIAIAFGGSLGLVKGQFEAKMLATLLIGLPLVYLVRRGMHGREEPEALTATL